MVTKQSIDEQLKKINLKTTGWGRTEINELPNIILPDEKIFECVNGVYEGGFALLVGTNVRVILVDKKPLNYLTVEDLRFDMINEIDYSHRLVGARISISTGSKNLKFMSFNQQRLRRLVDAVQHHMAEAKLKQSEHQEDQKLHLEQINQQLQSYLLAQHQQQQKLQEQLKATNGNAQQALASLEPVRPDPGLSDYLYAQSLLAQAGNPGQVGPSQPRDDQTAAASTPANVPSYRPGADDLYAEGVREVFGKQAAPPTNSTESAASPSQQASAPGQSQAQQQTPREPQDQAVSSSSSPLTAPIHLTTTAIQHALEINPLRIAHSKLPMAMRNRKFGRPSFHSHSQAKHKEEDRAASGEIAVAHY